MVKACRGPVCSVLAGSVRLRRSRWGMLTLGTSGYVRLSCDGFVKARLLVAVMTGAGVVRPGKLSRFLAC